MDDLLSDWPPLLNHPRGISTREVECDGSSTRSVSCRVHSDRLPSVHLLMAPSYLFRCPPLTRLPLIPPCKYSFYKSATSFYVAKIFLFLISYFFQQLSFHSYLLCDLCIWFFLSFIKCDRSSDIRISIRFSMMPSNCLLIVQVSVLCSSVECTSHLTNLAFNMFVSRF